MNDTRFLLNRLTVMNARYWINNNDGLFWNRNETADAYMRLYTEDNQRVTEAVYGRKYKLRVGVNNLDSKLEFN